jgi:hypothetical protein
MTPNLAGSQVDYSGWRVEQEWIAIKLIDNRGMTPIRLRETLDR